MKPRMTYHTPSLCCVCAVLAATAPATAAAQAERSAPMSYLRAMGTQAEAVVGHLWGLLAISIVVVVLIAVLVLIGSLRRRSTAGPDARYPVLRTTGGTAWITVGVGLSSIVLLGSMAWSAVVLTRIAEPPSEPAFTIDIRAHQWWWEVRYQAEDPSRSFETANEIHLPVGEPVRIALHSSDVIHSFWVPSLGGKTDMIPGQTNFTWLEAGEPGVYHGACQEYCGLQHALMRLLVVAQEPEAFEAWWDSQLEPAASPESASAREGEQVFLAKCGICHSVAGTSAGGNLGPNLTHLMSRRTLAAGKLKNTVANLSGWVANPQRVKPEATMPNIDLSGPQLNALRGFLATLR
jgi:cytochrome c oxidase subunit II